MPLAASRSSSPLPPRGGFPPDTAQMLCKHLNSPSEWSSDPMWFTAQHPIPVPLRGKTDVKRGVTWRTSGLKKEARCYALFSDLSIAWWRMEWQMTNPTRSLTIETRFRPSPGAWGRDDLITASKLYGDVIARFAENAVRNEQHVGRGECWDMASEAITSVAAAAPHLPKPVESIGRTHGHLIFHGEGGVAPDLQKGNWRGGDVCVRRGDIIEWRRAKVSTVHPRNDTTLGNPDHTAIIVEDSFIRTKLSPSPMNEDGTLELRPASIGTITVIEQAIRQLPVRNRYDLSTLAQGEVWIYRPISMAKYLGQEKVTAVWPPPLPAYETHL